MGRSISPYSKFEGSTIGGVFSKSKYKNPRDRGSFLKPSMTRQIQIELDDHENPEILKHQANEVFEKYNISKKVENWVENTMRWAHRNLFKKLINDDLNNFHELSRLLSREKFSLLFARNEYNNKLYPYPYQRIIEQYYRDDHTLITVDELCDIVVEDNMFSQLT